MKFKVTQEDIDNGIRRSSTTCPIALAAKRLLGIDKDSEKLSVTVESIDVWCDDNSSLTWILDDLVGAFVVDFDFGIPVYPIEVNAKPIRRHE